MNVQGGRERVMLRDLCQSVKYGYTARAQSEAIGPKFLRITDIVPESLDWSSVPHCEISTDQVEKYRLRHGDIVVARTGATTGYSKWIKCPPNAVFASYLVRLRIAEQYDSRYVGCVVESDEYKRFIQTNLGGAAQPNANAQVLTSFPVYLPPLLTQRKIAAMLSAYDNLIENNTRRIAILEEMTRALYREWFVHFRFPGHGEIPRVNSAIGPIAADWEVGCLDDALLLQRGFDLPTRDRVEGRVPVYAATGVVGTHNEAKVKAPGVVTGRSGTLGSVIYVEDDYWPLNTTLWVKEFRRATPLYAYYLLSDLHLENYNSGAAVPTLNRNDIKSLPVILPPTDLLRMFDDRTLPLMGLRKLLREKNEKLRRARDFLSPRLISGELDVSELAIETGKLDR